MPSSASTTVQPNPSAADIAQGGGLVALAVAVRSHLATHIHRFSAKRRDEETPIRRVSFYRSEERRQGGVAPQEKVERKRMEDEERAARRLVLNFKAHEERGESAQIIARKEEALQLATALAPSTAAWHPEHYPLDGRSASVVLHEHLGQAFEQLGMFAESVPVHTSRHEEAERHGDVKGQTYALKWLGAAYCASMQHDQALAFLRRRVELLESSRAPDGAHDQLFEASCQLGECLVHVGRVEEALQIQKKQVRVRRVCAHFLCVRFDADARRASILTRARVRSDARARTTPGLAVGRRRRHGHGRVGQRSCKRAFKWASICSFSSLPPCPNTNLASLSCGQLNCERMLKKRSWL